MGESGEDAESRKEREERIRMVRVSAKHAAGRRVGERVIIGTTVADTDHDKIYFVRA